MKQSNILCQVQCQRWGSWGERYCLQKQFCRKDKVQVWFFAWLKMMTGLISLLTHQYTLTHCLRCNSGWRGWRGRSIDLSGAERWSLFDLNLSSYSLFLPLLHCIIVYQELSNTCFLLTAMPLMKYQTSAQLVAGVLKPNLLSRFDPCNIFKVKPIKQNYCSKYEELVDGVKCP